MMEGSDTDTIPLADYLLLDDVPRLVASECTAAAMRCILKPQHVSIRFG